MRTPIWRSGRPPSNGCQKSTATNAGFWLPYIDLAAANGWLGNEAEAEAAITPAFTS